MAFDPALLDLFGSLRGGSLITLKRDGRPQASVVIRLKSAREDGETLLDRTIVLYGSNLGDANAHSTTNLPVLVAGGGFRHGQHLAFDAVNNMPRCRLYVSILQRFGLNVEQFATGRGTLPGLELA